MKKGITLFLFMLSACWVHAQIGGNGTYQFLTVSPNARINALGGYAIATPDADLHLSGQNPALLKKENDRQVGFSYLNYFTDIGAGEFRFAKHFDSIQTTFSAGLQYMSYGNFTRTSPDGQELGTFTAGEYNYHVSAARKYEQFSYGATLKFIYSNLDAYSSLGAAIDVGGTWQSEDELTMVSAVVSNVGAQITTYTQQNREQIPNNIQIGITKKFAHAPFRFGVVAHNLQQPGQLLYNISNRNIISLETGEPIQDQFSVLQKAMAHMVFNTELLLGKTLNFRFGYNILRKREMELSQARSMGGFTWGFGLRLSKFNFSYGFGGFVPGRNSNSFSVITNLHDFKKSKAKK
jgi:hypothetical protein